MYNFWTLVRFEYKKLFKKESRLAPSAPSDDVQRTLRRCPVLLRIHLKLGDRTDLYNV